MWKIVFHSIDDLKFFEQLDNTVIDEIAKYFYEVTKTFDALNSSAMCVNVVYHVISYTESNKKFSMEYNIDNEYNIIRITGIDIESDASVLN